MQRQPLRNQWESRHQTAYYWQKPSFHIEKIDPYEWFEADSLPWFHSRFGRSLSGVVAEYARLHTRHELVPTRALGLPQKSNARGILWKLIGGFRDVLTRRQIPGSALSDL